MLTSTNPHSFTQAASSPRLTGQQIRVRDLETLVRDRASTIVTGALGFTPKRGLDLEIESVTVNAEYDPGHHGADWGYAVVRRVGGRKSVRVIVHQQGMSERDRVETGARVTLRALTGREAAGLQGRRLARRLGFK